MKTTIIVILVLFSGIAWGQQKLHDTEMDYGTSNIILGEWKPTDRMTWTATEIVLMDSTGERLAMKDSVWHLYFPERAMELMIKMQQQSSKRESDLYIQNEKYEAIIKKMYNMIRVIVPENL